MVCAVEDKVWFLVIASSTPRCGQRLRFPPPPPHIYRRRCFDSRQEFGSSKRFHSGSIFSIRFLEPDKFLVAHPRAERCPPWRRMHSTIRMTRWHQHETALFNLPFAHLGRVTELEELRGQLDQPLGLDHDDLPHVLFGGQNQLVVLQQPPSDVSLRAPKLPRPPMLCGQRGQRQAAGGRMAGGGRRRLRTTTTSGLWLKSADDGWM